MYFHYMFFFCLGYFWGFCLTSACINHCYGTDLLYMLEVLLLHVERIWGEGEGGVGISDSRFVSLGGAQG